MATLLLAEVQNGKLNDATAAKALSAASALGGPVHVLAAQGGEAAAAEAASSPGRKVLLADDALYGHQLAEPTAALIVGLAGATTQSSPRRRFRRRTSCRASPRCSMSCRCPRSRPSCPLTRSSDRSTPATRSRRCSRRTQRGHHRSHCFLQGGGEGGTASVEKIGASSRPRHFPASSRRRWPSPIVGTGVGQDHRSGGRAMQSAENFKKYVEPVADRLGAAVGARARPSTPASPRTTGRSDRPGKVVAPDLYVALAFPGAIQHLGRHEGF